MDFTFTECVWQKYGRYKLTEKDCPKNAYFDEVHADCIAGKCEDCLPEMPEFIMCYKPGQRFQDPNDCKKVTVHKLLWFHPDIFLGPVSLTLTLIISFQYFTCTYQQNCGGRSYWGYEVTECTKDKYFSQKKKRCVHKTKCPQGTSGGKNYFWDDHSDDEPYPHDSDEN